MEYLIYNIDTLTDTEYEKWFSLMTEEKQEKVGGYKDINRKKASVAGEKLVKEYVGNATNTPPESLVITTGENGKPYIEGCEIHFNVSHCDDRVLCAFSTEEIGADIEKIKPATLSAAKQFFTQEEINFVFGFAPTADDFKTCINYEALERFYTIYTLKEAICKKSGIGIKGLKQANALPFLQHSFKENDFIISII